MSRMQHVFSNRKAFIGYLTAGQGGLRCTIDAALALIDGGVEILEIGIPFSDPIADGPVIQQAMEDALARGTTPSQVLEAIALIRNEVDTPIVLFSYGNPVLAAGSHYLHEAKEAGCDGILLIDMPIDDHLGMSLASQQANLSQVSVVSPSTPVERLGKLTTENTGFVYYACRKGVTGVQKGLPTEFHSKMSSLKQCLSRPVVAGFGIADKDSAEQVLQQADGFVVGSAFVQAVHRGASPQELSRLARDIDPRRSVYAH